MQTNNKTFLGRHFTEHSLLRRYFKNEKGKKILSFGCSTGEELLSLKVLFPNAELFGCDVDWHSMETARGLLGQSAVIFESDEKAITENGPYDIIICNSVLVLAPSIEIDGRKRGIDPILWTNVLNILDANLKEGGILQIINSNIPFRFHTSYSKYTPLRSNLILGPNFVDQFTPESHHLCNGVGGTGWSSVITRHTAGPDWEMLLPTDLNDVHFFKNYINLDGETPKEIHDEIIPNLPQNGIWAQGKMSYQSFVYPHENPLHTKTEVDINWIAIAIDTVRIERKVTRYWFDGSIVGEFNSVIETYGPTATAIIESAMGKRSTRISFDSLLNQIPIKAPQF